MKTSIVIALAGTAIALSCVSPASTAAPMAKTQAPGFYRMMLGDFEITALNDGVVDYHTGELLPGTTPEHIAKRLYAMGLSDPVGMSYNAFLINTGEKLVLIDTGSGGNFQIHRCSAEPDGSSPIYARPVIALSRSMRSTSRTEAKITSVA